MDNAVFAHPIRSDLLAEVYFIWFRIPLSTSMAINNGRDLETALDCSASGGPRPNF